MSKVGWQVFPNMAQNGNAMWVFDRMSLLDVNYDIYRVNGKNAVCQEAESNKDPLLANWISIDPGQNVVLQGNSRDPGVHFNMPVNANTVYRCTFYDYAPTGLTLNKTLPSPQPYGGTATRTDFTLSWSGPGGATGSGAGGVSRTLIRPGTYTISENMGVWEGKYAPGDWSCTFTHMRTGSSYTQTHTATGQSHSATITVPIEYDVSCSIRNTPIAPTITLIKTVSNNHGGTAVPADFTLSVTGPENFSGTAPAGPGETGTALPATNLSAGTYTLSETVNNAAIKASWYALSWSCTGATAQTGNQVTIGLGDQVVCRATNADQAPQLRLIKQVAPDTSTVSPGLWTLSAQTVGHSVSATGDALTTPVYQDVLASTAYTLSESGGDSDYRLVQWKCVDDVSGGELLLVDPNTDPAVLGPLSLGDRVTCTAINLHQGMYAWIDKSVVSGYPRQDSTGKWTIQYQVLVEGFTAAGDVDYELRDTLRFTSRDGLKYSSDGVTWLDFPGKLTGTLTQQNYKPDEYLFEATWIPHVNDDLTCDTGGMYNTASVTAGGQTMSDSACGSIAQPTVSKVWYPSLTAVDGDTVEFTYVVTVSNSSALPMSYMLEDELPTTTVGYTYDKVSASAGAGTPIPNVNWNGTTDPRLDGAGPFPTTRTAIAAGTTHRYTITVAVKLTSSDAVASLSCSGGGLRNRATMTSTNQWTVAATACYDLSGDLSLSKGVMSYTQDAGGTADISYTVRVTNDSENFPSLYSLADMLHFGTGITGYPQSTTVTGPEGDEIDWWSGDHLATSQWLEAGESHAYRITMTGVDLDLDSPDLEAACVTMDDGGLGNIATLTSPLLVDPIYAYACREPAAGTATIEKSVTSFTHDDAGWHVEYTITVTETSGTANAIYSLADYLQLGDGIDGGGGTREWTDWPDTVTKPAAPYDNQNNVVAINALLPAGETHTYVLALDGYDVDFDSSGSQLSCSTSGGFYNVVFLGVAGTTLADYACAEPTEPVFSKSAVRAEKVDGQTDTWDLVYSVIVANPAALSGTVAQLTYGPLVDEPDLPPGWTLTGMGASGVSEGVGRVTGLAVNGDWLSPLGTPTLVDSEVLLPGETHTYTLVLRVTIPEDTSPGTEFTCETGSTNVWNSATLTYAGVDVDDEACLPFTTPAWSLAKTSVPASGSMVEPGGTIEYTLTLTPTTGATAEDVVITDDLSAVLAGGTLTSQLPVGASIDANGLLTWDIGQLAGATPTDSGVKTLTYLITINDDAWDMQLENVATPAGEGMLPCDPDIEDCETNHTTPIDPEFSKDLGDLVSLGQGRWSVEYTITVTNPSTWQDTTYQLSDAIDFPAAWLEDSAVAVASTDGTAPSLTPGWDATTQPELVTQATLPLGVTHTFTVNFIVSVPGDAPVGDLVCSGNGGLINRASVTLPGWDIDDEACAEPILPLMSKTPQGATKVLGEWDTWELAYTITVQNPVDVASASGQLTYGPLEDSPTLPTGWTLTDSSVTPTTAGSSRQSPPQVNPQWLARPGDTTLVSAETLLPGETHTYDIVLTIKVPSDTPPGTDFDCEPGSTNVWNTATITRAGGTADDEACNPFTTPAWTLAKTSVPASGSMVEPGGTIEYTLSVTPTTGTAAEDVVITDDLSAVLAGGTLTSQLPAGASIDANGLLTWTIGQLPGATSTDPGVMTLTYTITINDDAWDMKLGNVATPTGQGLIECDPDIEDCETNHTTPVQPEFSKDVDGLVYLGQGRWMVTYAISATNPSTWQDTSYQLVDAIDFPASWLESTAVAAQSTAGLAPTPDSTWNGTSQPTLVSQATLPKGVTHSFVVDMTVNIPSGTPTTALVCEGPGGLLNRATLDLPGWTSDDEACAEPLLFAVGRYAWLDANYNGVLEDDEDPMPGITVKLLDAAGGLAINALGEAVEPVVTDENGAYLFDELLPGSYVVEFSRWPTTHHLTHHNVEGAPLGRASMAHLETGRSPVIDLSLDSANVSKTMAGIPVSADILAARVPQMPAMIASVADLTINAGFYQPPVEPTVEPTPTLEPTPTQEPTPTVVATTPPATPTASPTTATPLPFTGTNAVQYLVMYSVAAIVAGAGLLWLRRWRKADRS